MSELKKYQITTSETGAVAEAALVYDTPFKKVSLSRNGISVSFVLDLLARYQLSKSELASLIDISAKTMDRHLASNKIFSGLQAERLLRLAELYDQGIDVFGNPNKFLKWLNAEIAVLDNTSPKSWLDTYHGIEIISDEMGRIQHGIFS